MPTEISREGDTLTVAFGERAEFAKEYEKNIKAGGIFLDLADPPAMSATVKVRLRVEDACFEIMGQVVWRNPAGAGVQFTSLTSDVKQEIEKFLSAGGEASSSEQLKAAEPETVPEVGATEASVRGGQFCNEFDLGAISREQVSKFWDTKTLMSVCETIEKTKRSCVLEVRGEDIADRMRMLFISGVPCHSEKFLDSRDVGLLMRKEMISDVEFAKAKKEVASKGCSFRDAFVNLGIAKQEDVEKVIKLRLDTLLSKAIVLPKGQFGIKPLPDGAANQNYLKTDVPNLLFRGLLQRMKDQPRGSLEGHLAERMREVPIAVQDGLRLRKDEEKLWSLLQSGSNRLGDFLQRSPFNKEETYAYLFALLAASLVTFRQSVVGADEADSGQRIAALHARVTKQNPFAALGLHWSSHYSHVEAAKERMKRKFETLLRLKGVTSAGRDQVNDMIVFIEKCAEALTSTKTRREARNAFVDESQRKSSARILFQKAQMAVMRKEVKEARELIECAIDLEPNREHYLKAAKTLGARTNF